MRTRLALLCLLFPCLLQAAEWKSVLFNKDDLGKVPAGWEVARTGKGAGSEWKLVADDSAPSKSGLALAQVASSPKAMFNLCIVKAGRYRDLELSVAFKAVEGEIDQGGGLVWRYQDANNYYVARMNPLEDNYRVYKVVDGVRKQLGTQEGLKVKPGEWHRLGVRQQGEQITCSLDGKPLLEARDDAIRSAGQVGLWSKADARTRFDSFAVSELK